MKRVCFLVLFMSLSFMAAAQQVSYSYYLAGNRVKREIVMSQKAPKKPVTTGFTESLGKKGIRIYPNPTKGHLKVEITDYESSDECTLLIVNASGARILQKEVDSNSTTIDISSQSNGLYILHISLNGEKSSWKIIKK